MCQDAEVTVPRAMMTGQAVMGRQSITPIPAEVGNRELPLAHS
jgi:hypothetical protein